MTHAHPAPYAHGAIAADGGASIYWEESGTPDGVPALWLHGGPGGSLGDAWHRSMFDPDRYRLIGIDQRGSGRSRPNILDARDTLASHTTQQLIADIEAVRDALGVERWVVAGMSWGTTLALAYALEHPDRVRALALTAVTTTSREEVEWITEGVGRIFPEEWAAFERASDRVGGERIVDAYARRLAGGESTDREAAARDWDTWEGVHVSLDHPESRHRGHTDLAEREAFATLVTHFWSNDAFLPGEMAVLARIDEIRHIPAALVHGRRDISGPPITAWRLHRAWPASTLTIIEDEGHGGPRSCSALSDALDRFAAEGAPGRDPRGRE
ncbi:prolyl aminopeptidase [Microbacterium sp. DT81.1]|uniref:prolyl aminopeptidase n=1 Tax=Microbacterium sp. DT81.1 TaxID=3393413 RepID=UPI003CE9C6CC